MTAPRDILIVPVGSHGDVHPFIGIGLGLRDRGHRVRVIVNPHFDSIVRGAGLETIPLGTDAEYRELASHPDLWDRLRGPRYIFQKMAAMVPPVYHAITEHYVPGRTIVVHSTLAMGARVAQDKFGIPTATIHLQPAVIRSAMNPPILPGAILPRWLPVIGRKLILRFADHFVLDPMVAPQVNEFRATLGLPPMRRIIQGWWDSPQLVIGLFPEWYAPPQADWSPQIRLTGFPLYDERGVSPFDESLDDFLRSGSPPVAFTPGSAMWKADAFFAEGAKACKILGRRGLLLSRHADHIPGDLPEGVIHVPYAPFSELLPRCAAIVHHGGIGTTAQAMASGVPQLIMPFSHDQPDNADRVKELGVAEVLWPRQFTSRKIAAALTRILDNPKVKEACNAVARRFQSTDAIGRTCDLIEQLSQIDTM
jgi:UDP:flavonoid glycosyltransferase YjiC (YdhE family)